MIEYTPKYKINDLLRYQTGPILRLVEVSSIAQDDSGELNYFFIIKKIISAPLGMFIIIGPFNLSCLDFDNRGAEIVPRVDYEAEKQIHNLLKLKLDLSRKN